jgi:hypothetical protein
MIWFFIGFRKVIKKEHRLRAVSIFGKERYDWNADDADFGGFAGMFHLARKVGYTF